MVTTRIINDNARMTADYDSAADVLYVMINAPEPVEGDGLPDGIELDYSLRNGKPCGVTVIGYRQYGWPNKADKLAKIVGKHLTLRPSIISSTLSELMQAH